MLQHGKGMPDGAFPGTVVEHPELLSVVEGFGYENDTSRYEDGKIYVYVKTSTPCFGPDDVFTLWKIIPLPYANPQRLVDSEPFESSGSSEDRTDTCTKAFSV